MVAHSFLLYASNMHTAFMIILIYFRYVSFPSGTCEEKGRAQTKAVPSKESHMQTTIAAKRLRESELESRRVNNRSLPARKNHEYVSFLLAIYIQIYTSGIRLHSGTQPPSKMQTQKCQWVFICRDE